jgi:hypothetical protein
MPFQKKNLPAFEPVEDTSMTENMELNPSNPIIASGYLMYGYKIGKPLNTKKDNVFKCQNLSTMKTYVCKLAQVPGLDTNIFPIETQVYKALQKSPHESLAAMHELIGLGIIDGNNTFMEVIDDYGIAGSWICLFDYLRYHDWPNSREDSSQIFEPILEAVAHLFSLGFTHGDIKGKNYLMYQLRI